MGIKGIYREIGTGQRISLCKLAVEHLEETGRPFRLAIDFSIWQFQVQAARGGSNPAIRTLFYRLVRLLGHSIEPIFVFDGPNKPAFKRNKRSGRGDGVATAMAKRLIRLFGFQIHDAPGEAEAECALLQQLGMVDAVLSEDVDTIMFGCTRTLRNWSAEGVKGSKTPTHVSMYDTEQLRQGDSGLDREGMVLVALMSGGDYLPEGVPGCGVKVACEAARGGFGKSLCRIKKADTLALDQWRSTLLHELRTNQSGFFRTKHKALVIPDDFPKLEILRYYTHPVVSQPATLEKLKAAFPSNKPVKVEELREFVQETFDWSYKIGAIKYIRVLAPSLLVQKLIGMSTSGSPGSEDLDLVQESEAAVVKGVSNKRSHFSTDATPELRVSYVPADLVKIDLDAEPDEVVDAYGRGGLALNSDDDFDEPVGEALEEGGKNGAKKTFDPLQPDTIWIPETLVKLGAPLAVEDWEEKQREKERVKLTRTTKSITKSRPAKKTGMPVGALDKYMNVTKAPSTLAGTRGSSSKLRPPFPSIGLPPLSMPATVGHQVQRRPISTAKPPAALPRSKLSKNTGDTATSKQANPWTFAGSQISPRVIKHTGPSEAIIISSSPPQGPSSPALDPPMKRVHTPPSKENSFRSAHGASPTRNPRKKSSPVAIKSSQVTTTSRNPRSPAKKVGGKPPDRSQMSIRSFGSLFETKTGQTAAVAEKGNDRERESPCIEILSDSDDDEPSLPDIRSLPRKSDDPFAPLADDQITNHKQTEYTSRVQGSSDTATNRHAGKNSEARLLKSDQVCYEESRKLGCTSSGSDRRTKKTLWRSSEVSTIDMTNDY